MKQWLSKIELTAVGSLNFFLTSFIQSVTETVWFSFQFPLINDFLVYLFFFKLTFHSIVVEPVVLRLFRRILKFHLVANALFY